MKPIHTHKRTYSIFMTHKFHRCRIKYITRHVMK